MERLLLVNLLTLLLAVIFIFWKFTDPRPRKERINSYFSKKGILIGIFTFIFMASNYISGLYFPLPSSMFDNLLTYLGLMIFLGGYAFAIWAKIAMGKVWGMPASFDRSRQNKLIKSGPFKYSRNPIYVGLIMVAIGYGLSIQSYFTFLVLLPIFYFASSVEKEEKTLEEHFGSEYLKYKKEVPRFF